ncbi:MAG: S8 family serine peptidase [Phycisphaerae bacterium]
MGKTGRSVFLEAVFFLFFSCFSFTVLASNDIPTAALDSTLEQLRKEIGIVTAPPFAMINKQDSVIASPSEPAVKPLIMVPKELDKDGNGIDDKLDAGLRRIRTKIAKESNPETKRTLENLLTEPVRVELIFSRQITRSQIDVFQALGGQIEYIYKAVSYGWNAYLPVGVVEKIPQQMGIGFVAVVADQPAKPTLDEATRTGRVRPVWVPGFAGSSSGLFGSATTTIGILDTGIDDSHTDLAGRQEYWKDWTSDKELSPRDIGQHGSHVTGIALGTGAAEGTNALLYYTDSGNMSSLNNNYYYPSPIHIPNGLNVTFSSTAYWVGGRTTNLYGFYRSNGSAGSYSALSAASSGSSPLNESNSFIASSANHYSAGLIQNTTRKVGLYAVANAVTYAGVGDGFNTLRGVAPGCRWAVGKVFLNNGSGSSLDIQEAVDDMVVQRITHNIKVVNMSLGIIGNPGLDTTLRSKVNNMVDNGIIAVCSAGNDGPGTAGSNVVDDPGRAGKAITVAAANDINQLTEYTSSGFSSPGSDEDYKPDVMAPGGSDYYSKILSVDSNDSDADSTTFSDKQLNDYANMEGTSMACPCVAGACALVIQALEQSGVTWNFYSSSHPLLVKMLLCATCTESNANREVSSGTNPTLGRAASPKDLYEGYGMINPDAAVEAVLLVYSSGTTGSTDGGYFNRRAWGRKVTLTSGSPVKFTLNVPSTGDFDLYLYSSTPDSKGNPIIRASSTNAGNGTGETINFMPSVSETSYLVIKRAAGYGSWTLTSTLTVTGVITLGDYIADVTAMPATIEFRDPGTLVSRDNQTTTLDSGSTYSVTTGLPPGLYDLSVKKSPWLRQTKTNVDLLAGSNTVNFTLINGDCDGNDEVTSTDLSVVLAAMDTVSPSPNWDPTADLDGDLNITSADLSIVLLSMDQMGNP